MTTVTRRARALLHLYGTPHQHTHTARTLAAMGRHATWTPRHLTIIRRYNLYRLRRLAGRAS